MPRWITEGPSAPSCSSTRWQPGSEREGCKQQLWKFLNSKTKTLVHYRSICSSSILSCLSDHYFPSFCVRACTSPSPEQAPIIDGEKRKNKLFSLRRLKCEIRLECGRQRCSPIFLGFTFKVLITYAGFACIRSPHLFGFNFFPKVWLIASPKRKIPQITRFNLLKEEREVLFSQTCINEVVCVIYYLW